MRRACKLMTDGKIISRLICSLTIGLFLGLSAIAQNPGSPVVFKAPTGNVYSNAYIDASVFVGNHDFCSTLNIALQKLSSTTNYPNGAGVIDARGVSVAAACTSGDSNPWGPLTVPATILLPAGTIKTQSSWILPSGTRLIGEGGEDPGSNDMTTARTIIQSQLSFSGSAIIQMGTGAGCTGVSIENVVLDGGPFGGAVDGIDNPYCLDQSYVDKVTLFRIVKIGLNVYNNTSSAYNATNSGPYSNITFDPAALTTGIGTYGAYLGYTTRGIAGMTCTTGTATVASNTSGTCVYLGAPGNSVQDLRVEGFSSGVDVAASNSVLMNIDGDTNPKSGSTTLNVVKIESTEKNVALIGIANNCSGSSSCTTDGSDLTIQDVAGGTNLSVLTDPFVAMYVLGDTPSAGVYSRYTTSGSAAYTTNPKVATWSAGSAAIPSTTPCPTPGSLYSNNTANSVPALYVCSALNSKWSAVK